MSDNRIHSKEELGQIVETVSDTLKNIYDEKGKNFNVRMRYLVKISGVGAHTLTNLRNRLPIREKIKTARGILYETTFDGKSTVKK